MSETHAGWVTVDIPLRWADLDAQGHVNNALYADYLQEARVDFLLAGGRSVMLETGVVVVGHQLEYLRPITFSSRPVQVELGVLSLGASRFELGYRLHHDGELMARARSVMCPFELSHQRPRRLTGAERDWFAGHSVSGLEQLRPLTRIRLDGRGHVHPVRPRWSDVDRFQHVNNVRVFDYVQEARIAMTTAADPSMARAGAGELSVVESDTSWLVVRQDIDYLGQLSFRADPYHLITAVVAVGRSSITLNAEVVDPDDGGAVLGRAATVLVCADAAGVPKALSQQHRDRLSRWMVG